MFSKRWMLAFYSLTKWKKPEYPEDTTGLEQASATTTLPYANTGNRAQIAAVAGEGCTPALSRLFDDGEVRLKVCLEGFNCLASPGSKYIFHTGCLVQIEKIVFLSIIHNWLQSNTKQS